MRLAVFIWAMVVASVGHADIGPALGGLAFASVRAPIPDAPIADDQAKSRVGASLFSAGAKGSLLARYPVRTPPVAQPAPAIAAPSMRAAPDRAVDVIRDIIGRAESPRAGYNAVQHGARIKPRKKPTDMTIGEIYDWIAATPGQPHAIGRYQFIPPTLRSVVSKTGARRSDMFTPAMQDRLADVLLEDAGFSKFMAGNLGRQRFMNNLAAIWAGLPTSTGRSKYHGHAGNRATITLAEFRSEIAKIDGR